MNKFLMMKPEMLIALLFYQTTLQQQLIEAQEQIITLQKQLKSLTPKTPRDKDVYWHIASGGTLSIEAANSDNIATVRKFRDWNIKFAQKHIQPYVSPKVYGECVNQMTRGLSERIAQLQTEEEAASPDEKKSKAKKSPNSGASNQPLLIH